MVGEPGGRTFRRLFPTVSVTEPSTAVFVSVFGVILVSHLSKMNPFVSAMNHVFFFFTGRGKNGEFKFFCYFFNDYGVRVVGKHIMQG